MVRVFCLANRARRREKEAKGEGRFVALVKSGVSFGARCVGVGIYLPQYYFLLGSQTQRSVCFQKSMSDI